MTSLMEVQDSSFDLRLSILGKSKSPGVLVPLVRVVSMMLRTSDLFMLMPPTPASCDVLEANVYFGW